MIVEVQIKIGNSNPGNFNPRTNAFDGMPIHWRSPGIHISANEILAFVQSGTIPADWSKLSLSKRQEKKHDLKRIRYLTSGVTAEEAATERVESGSIVLPDGRIQMPGGRISGTFRALIKDAEHQIAVATAERVVILSEGLDTNWSSWELHNYGHVMADVPTLDDLEDLIIAPADESRHVFARRLQKGHRRWKMRYLALLSAATIDKWVNTNLRVNVKRNATPFNWTELKEDAPS